MPNWVYHKVLIEGTNEVIKNIISKYFTKKDSGYYLDFNLVIPQPKSVEDCPDKYVRKDKINEPPTELDERPWFDWYNWNCDNWGTKWNTNREDTNIYVSDGLIEIYLSTAWSPATNIFEKILKDNTGISISGIYADESRNFTGYFETIDGELIDATNDSDSKEDFETYFDLCGGEDEYFFDEDLDNYVYDEYGYYESVYNLSKELNKIIKL